jgi:hypothetical protein
MAITGGKDARREGGKGDGAQRDIALAITSNQTQAS